jgi:hypothetical protein
MNSTRRGKTGNSGTEGEGCGLWDGLGEGEEEGVVDELGEGVVVPIL